MKLSIMSQPATRLAFQWEAGTAGKQGPRRAEKESCCGRCKAKAGRWTRRPMSLTDKLGNKRRRVPDAG